MNTRKLYHVIVSSAFPQYRLEERLGTKSVGIELTWMMDMKPIDIFTDILEYPHQLIHNDEPEIKTYLVLNYRRVDEVYSI